MKAVYNDSSVAEKEAKSRYFFPENIMMENAASALEREIDGFFCTVNNFTRKSEYDCPFCTKNVLILCGSGNNGGDGLALARRIYGKYDVKVVLISAPKTDEAKLQQKMAQAVGVEIMDFSQFEQPALSRQNSTQTITKPFAKPAFVPDIIVDCIFGTGFHGELPTKVKSLLELINENLEYKSSYKIACDIPSALFFKADVTVTMGALKSILFTDKAKDVTGKIKVADLGISSSIFEQCSAPDAFLIEESDVKLPFRTKKSAHKGTYGHTAVFAGEKSGAAILAAQAAAQFGSGLTTIIKSTNSNLEQFKITPELMIADSIPKTTTAILLGPGLGTPDKKTLDAVKEWFKSNFSSTAALSKSPALVLDADMLTYQKIAEFLTELCNSQIKESSLNAKNVRIILTPHPKELAVLFSALGFSNYTAVQAAEHRFEIAKQITQKFPQLTLILKSANTVIAAEGQIFICDQGCQSLAKGGSGDVLAGMTASLLAQGYSAKDAAITAVYAHALASKNFSDGTGWNLTPLALIEQIKNT